VRLINDVDLRREMASQFGTIESVQALHQGKENQLSAKLLATLAGNRQ
jgi:hypothetical protein